MAGIKEKISSALHKDHAHGDTRHTHGTGGLGTTTGDLHTGHTTTGGTGLGTGTGVGTGVTSGTGTGLTSGTGTGLTSGTGTGLTSGTGTGLTSGTGTGLTGTGTGITGHHHHHHGTGELVGGSPQVIDSKVFTKTEDHEVLIEKKAYELQHRPVEKEYVVETRYVGEQRVPGAATELVGTEARQIEERVVEAPRGDREVIIENVDVPRELLQGQTHHHTTGLTSTTGTTGTTGTSGLGTSTPGSTGNTTF